MLHLNHLGVEVFIKKAKNIDPFWDNYSLIIWKKDSSGYTNKNGMFRKDSWGIAETVPLNNQGICKLSKKYVKYFK